MLLFCKELSTAKVFTCCHWTQQYHIHLQLAHEISTEGEQYIPSSVNVVAFSIIRDHPVNFEFDHSE